MIKITFKPPVTQEWVNWCRDCGIRANGHLADYRAGKQIRISEALYNKQRDPIFEACHGKCAYCEANFKLDQSGDVEHFRPKGGTTDENDRPIEISDGNGGRRPHPGYFWLAYEWTNLRPSCAKCNRPARLPNGRLVGKWNRFPVRGQHAESPEDVAAEAALLLNPVVDDPTEDLDFDPDTGLIFAVGNSPRGRMCIDVLGLNREGLPEARRDAYDAVMARDGDDYAARRDGRPPGRHADFIKRHKDGSAEYAMAGRKAIATLRRILEQKLRELSSQIP